MGKLSLFTAVTLPMYPRPPGCFSVNLSLTVHKCLWPPCSPWWVALSQREHFSHMVQSRVTADWLPAAEIKPWNPQSRGGVSARLCSILRWWQSSLEESFGTSVFSQIQTYLSGCGTIATEVPRMDFANIILITWSFPRFSPFLTSVHY